MPLTLAQMHALIADGGANTAQDVRDVTTALYDWVSPVDKYLMDRQPDETAHVDDDFFPGTTPGGTAVTISGTATWTQKYNRLSCRFDGQAATDGAFRLYPLTPSAAPVTIEMAIEVMQPIGVHQFGVCLTDGEISTSNLVASMYVQEATGFYSYSGTLTDIGSTNQIGATGAAHAVPWGRIYLRVIWSAANTFKHAWSPDGISWTNFGITTVAKTMTPTRFGLLVSAYGATEQAIASASYFRVNELDLGAA